MSVNKLINNIKAQVLASVGNVGYCDIGKIADVNPGGTSVTAVIHSETEDDEALKTGWMPMCSPWVGAGWGMFATPTVGDLCLVLYQQGSRQAPIGAILLFSPSAKPNVPSGEFWLLHASGSYTKLTNDGKLSLNGNAEVDLTSPKLAINITGECDVTADAKITLTAPAIDLNASSVINLNSPSVNLGSGSLSALMNASSAGVFNSHTHDSGAVGAPDQKMTGSNETTNVRGG